MLERDEIIEMAREAGLETQDGFSESVFYFAKLVADVATAKEREACAKTVETIETYEKIEKACFKFAAKTIRARGCEE